MKKFLEDIINTDTLLTVCVALVLGMFIGVFFKSGYSVGIRTFFHDLYLKTHPEAQKDSKTIIMERVTKDTPNLPQKDIFEQPEKKENGFILFIKRVFVKKEEKPQNINDFVLNQKQ